MDFLKNLWAKHGEEILASKKVKTFVVGSVAGLVARIGLPEEMASEVAIAIWTLAGVLIGGFAAQDFGKAKAKIEKE